MLTQLLSALLAQTLYGPAVPPAPPAPPQAEAPAVAPSFGSDAVLRANGLSEDGLRALQGVPQPPIARGATRAAQCTVEQLSAQTPLPLADLVAALHERDATAAAQAAATTDYLVSALRVLHGADQRVLLAVLGTGGVSVGGPPPPRPDGARPGPDGGMARRGPGGPGSGGRGGPGGGFGAGGPPDGERMARSERAGPPQGAPRGPRPASPCDIMLGD